ncbi:MAG TPA: transposase [Chitinophagaceae bacterium]|jgi:transposase-like protein|nr:transposase [Chitinophagaceae bacterium]
MKQALGKVFKKGKPRSLRKGTEPYDVRLKTKIITEYLKGDKSYAMLGRQYRINPGIISRWVRIARHGRPPKANPQKITKFTGMKEGINKTLEQLQQENRALKKRLEDEELKNLILEKVLEIGKRDYNIDLKKKYEAKRPLK